MHWGQCIVFSILCNAAMESTGGLEHHVNAMQYKINVCTCSVCKSSDFLKRQGFKFCNSRGGQKWVVAIGTFHTEGQVTQNACSWVNVLLLDLGMYASIQIVRGVEQMVWGIRKKAALKFQSGKKEPCIKALEKHGFRKKRSFLII